MSTENPATHNHRRHPLPEKPELDLLHARQEQLRPIIRNMQARGWTAARHHETMRVLFLRQLGEVSEQECEASWQKFNARFEVS